MKPTLDQILYSMDDTEAAAFRVLPASRKVVIYEGFEL